VLQALSLGAVVGLPLLNVAPNRLVSGQPVSLLAVVQDLAGLAGPPFWAPMQLSMVGSAAVMLVGVGFARPSRRIHGTVVLLTCAVFLGLLTLCGAYADHLSQAQTPLARSSLGSAFWVLTFTLWLTLMDAFERLRAGPAIRLPVWLGMLGALFWLLASGRCNQLSLMKEYANHADTFVASVLRHLQIVLLTLLPTLCLGLPLGWAVNRSQKLQQWLLPPLNIIQTIPSIALFGLLMLPLAWLAGTWPQLAAWGVSGIGLAPAVVALTLYSLLPVVRGTQAALAQVPAGVLQAARGMGMSPLQMAWRAQLPLAAPVILAGVRTATLQLVGLAAVAALIGAGGLGAIMFDGLFGSAQDLVLLGVLPILGLALLMDMGFQLLIRLVSPVAEGAAG
jgi:osmoprotectant transport system permease protein